MGLGGPRLPESFYGLGADAVRLAALPHTHYNGLSQKRKERGRRMLRLLLGRAGGKSTAILPGSPPGERGDSFDRT